jgi:deazaflavin-dependent oxidoreductase (nitroreductase family)
MDINMPHVEKPVARAQTLRHQKLANRLVLALLRAPLVSRAIGRRLVTIYVIGRKTGSRFAVPVAYTRHDGALLVASEFPWIRNLRSGDTVDIRLAGRRQRAAVRVLTEEVAVVEHLALMASDNHQFAKFNKIGFDEHDAPVLEDLHLAWAAGTRIALLTPQ